MVFLLLLIQKPNAVLVNVVNDDVNVNIVSAKVVAITKAKLQAIAKVVDPVDEIDPVVEIVHEKGRGRPTIFFIFF